jgi:hypothetical protein
MKIVPAIAAVLALTLPRALPAQSFEGKVTMNTQATDRSGKTQSIEIKLSLKPGFTRQDMTTAQGQVTLITDFAQKKVYMLMAKQQMCMIQALKTPVAPAGAATPSKPSNLTDTGVKDTILGYSCEKYVSTEGSDTTEIWITDELGTYAGLFQGATAMRGQQAPGWDSSLAGKGFFPMRVVSTSGGATKFRLDVTAVDKGTPPDSDFAVPQGWRTFDMSAGGMPFARPPSGGNY